MKIKKVVVGEKETNCYLLEINRKVLIIDPGAESEKIKKEIGSKKVRGIIITHNHEAHNGCALELKDYYNTKIFDHNNLKPGYRRIKEFKFDVLRTPGHSKDSISLYFVKDKAMFVGCTVLKGSVGSLKYEDSNRNSLYRSIIKIKKYPDNTKLYTGHGDITKLKDEKEENPYF